jgi:RNA polymerase sigma factor (sigma-70 family)
MPTSVIEHIRTVVADGVGLRDGELLGRYVDRRDEAALAALVNRHAPMVWGVCRRQLSHHDAEDAFQATFIVLVRKAASIAQREVVGNWLYGVAHQMALQARRSAARRRAREVQVTEMPDAEAPQEQPADLQPFLDEELSRLPDHYRTVIVLSDLEGRTRKEVAAQFGCPEGTVASRLARARSMLAKRLTQRGVALSGGALAVVLSQSTGSAGVPAAVVSSTIKAASLCAAGKAMMPVKVAALAEGVLKAMLMSKLKAIVAVVLVLGFLAIGAIGVSVASAQQKGEPVAQPKAQKVDGVALKEKADNEEGIAWGKEVDGLQMGLVADASTCRQGAKFKLTVMLRNVGKAETTVNCGILQEWAPQVTTDTGGRVTVYMPAPFDGLASPIKRAVKPGEAITLYNPAVSVASEVLMRLKGIIRVDTPTISVAPGKYKIAFDGMIQSHPKLSTGTVEFEVKPASVTAWGKEYMGLQAGLGFRPGERRAYIHGETVTLVVRVRTVNKNLLETRLGGRPVNYIPAYFFDWPPYVTDGEGKPGPQIRFPGKGGDHNTKELTLAPGKEVELAELKIDLRPESESSNKKENTLYGTGKFQIQYERLMYSSGKLDIGSILRDLATGKLELEIKSAEKK